MYIENGCSASQEIFLNKTNYQSNPPVWILSLGAGLAPFAVTLVAPAIPTLTADLNANPTTAQWVLSVLLISIACGQLVAGPISDTFGRKPLFLGGAIAYCLAGFGAVFSQTIETIIFFRIIQGLGAAAAVAMSRSIVGDLYNREQSAGVMSTIIAMMAIIPVLGTSFGGLLADLTGWQGSFMTLAITGLFLTYAVKFRVQETHKPEHERGFTIKNSLVGYTMLMSTPKFLASAITTASQTAIFFTLMSFVAYSFNRMGINAKEFGVWMAMTSVGYIVGNLANKRFLAFFRIEYITLFGALISLISLLVMQIWYNYNADSPLSLAIPMILVGFSNGIMIANSIILASSALPNLRGSANGLVGALQMTAGGISGTVAIWLGAAQDTSTGILVLLVVSFCSLLSSIWSAKISPVN